MNNSGQGYIAFQHTFECLSIEYHFTFRVSIQYFVHAVLWYDEYGSGILSFDCEISRWVAEHLQIANVRSFGVALERDVTLDVAVDRAWHDQVN